MQKGDTLFASGDLPEAINAFSEVIARDSGNYEAYYKRGIALRNSKRFAEAILDFNEAVELSPDFSLAYSARGLTYALWDNIDLAMADMDKAIRMDNNNARTIENNMVDAYFNLGIAFREHGKSLYAQAFLGKVIGIKPEWAPGYIERSKIHTINKAYDMVIVDLNKAIKYDPNSFEAYLLRSAAYLNQGKYDLAFKDAEKSIAIDGKSAAALANRGRIYYNKGDYDKALFDLNTSISIDGSSYEAFYYRALVYYSKKMTGPAIADFEAVMAMKNVDSEILSKSQNYISDLSSK